MASSVVKLDQKYNYSDYYSWPDNERWELIDGVPYNMSPAPNRLHQKVLTKLIQQIANYLESTDCEAYVAPFDVRLRDLNSEKGDENILTVVQPDISVFCDKEKLDKRGAIGAPEIIIEILSKSTAYKDQTIKMKLYQKHGVKEYIMIHPDDQLIYILRLGENKLYDKALILEASETLTFKIFPDLSIDLTKLFKDNG